MRPIGRSFLSLLAAILFAGCLSAQVPDRNVIPNWPVPATWTPPRPEGALSTMTDISQAMPFIAITPCRIADTRAGQGFSAQAGPPILNTGTRTFQITGTVSGVPAQCDIPPGADAVSFQFTIIQPNTDGNLIAWPAGGPLPTISVLNWAAGIFALGNGTIVPVSASGALSVRINAAVGTAVGHLVIDVNGYFADDLAAGQLLEVTGSRLGPMIVALNTSTSDLSGASGVFAQVQSSHADSAAVRGVVATSTGSTNAIQGFNASNSSNSSGVSGLADVLPNTSGAAFFKSGVRGESKDGNGTIGISEVTGVGGFLMDSSNGTITAEGRLGALFGTDPDPGGPPWGVHAIGAIGATGVKAFLEPHPTDPTKVIQYIALEGPEAGTYFRGRARFQRGLARISVPENFRMVTDPEGLTVQITPMGGMATFGVVRADLREIVVEGSRELEFSYLVQGVRASFKDVQPVIRDGTFVPQSADAKLPSSLAERQKRVLIQNGVYKEDGSVNMETARRLGWDRMWKRRNATPQPRPEEGR